MSILNSGLGPTPQRHGEEQRLERVMLTSRVKRTSTTVVRRISRLNRRSPYSPNLSARSSARQRASWCVRVISLSSSTEMLTQQRLNLTRQIRP